MHEGGKNEHVATASERERDDDYYQMVALLQCSHEGIPNNYSHQKNLCIGNEPPNLKLSACNFFVQLSPNSSKTGWEKL